MMEQRTVTDATTNPTYSACGAQNDLCAAFECSDTWNPSTLTLAGMRAYKALEANSTITILHVYIQRHTERVKVRYVSTVPHSEALKLLGDIKRTAEDQ